jgi:hypothetical protein
MRKILVTALIVTISLPIFASSTTDQRTFIVQKKDVSDSFTLNTQTTRTEHRIESVEGTCYRQEISGH